jgi:hypothetical protein
MYFSISQYPEFASHAKADELKRLFNAHKTTPIWLWLIHVLAVVAISYVSVDALWQRFALVVGYLVGIYLLGVNLWYRSQFLVSLPKLSERALACPITAMQDAFNGLWKNIDAYTKLELTLFSQPTQPLLNYGYLSLKGGQTQAPIKIEALADNKKQLSLLLTQEQILPFVLAEGAQVNLQLGGMPLTAQITKLERVTHYQLEEPLALDRNQMLHVFRFNTAPTSLSVETKAKSQHRNHPLYLRLVHIDKNNLVAFSLIEEPTESLVIGEKIIFPNGDEATLVNVYQPFYLLRH